MHGLSRSWSPQKKMTTSKARAVRPVEGEEKTLQVCSEAEAVDSLFSGYERGLESGGDDHDEGVNSLVWPFTRPTTLSKRRYLKCVPAGSLQEPKPAVSVPAQYDISWLCKKPSTG